MGKDKRIKMTGIQLRSIMLVISGHLIVINAQETKDVRNHMNYPAVNKIKP